MTGLHGASTAQVCFRRMADICRKLVIRIFPGDKELNFYKYVPLIFGMFAWVTGGNLVTRRAAGSAGLRRRPGLSFKLLRKMTPGELVVLVGCLLAFFGGFVATVLLS